MQNKWYHSGVLSLTVPEIIATEGGEIVVSEIENCAETVPTIGLLEKVLLALVTSYGEFLIEFEGTELSLGSILILSELIVYTSMPEYDVELTGFTPTVLFCVVNSV